MTTQPLFTHNHPDAVLALRQGRAVTAGAFLSTVAALAGRLPARAHVLNLCRDRYLFTVGLAAALCRGQLTLLPPNETPAMLAQLAAEYPGLYALTEEGPALALPFPTVSVHAHAGRAERWDIPKIAAEQPAMVLFTSGSTGRSMPHPRSFGALAVSTHAASHALKAEYWPKATVIATVPPQHSFGLESSVMLPLQNGFVLTATRPFFPADIAAELAAAPRPRLLVTTPIHLRALMAGGAGLPQADLVLSATAPLSQELAREVEARFAAPVHEIYGCTEVGQIASRRTMEGPLWRCIDGLSLRQEGARSFARRHQDGAETPLGDLIELKDAGSFVLHGRLGDLINIAGKRSTLGYLNAQLTSIPGVRDGLFVMPPETEGEAQARLIAFAVAPGLTAEEILSALRQRLDAAFLPRPLHLVEDLPRNVLGKLPLAELADLMRRVDAG